MFFQNRKIKLKTMKGGKLIVICVMLFISIRNIHASESNFDYTWDTKKVKEEFPKKAEYSLSFDIKQIKQCVATNNMLLLLHTNNTDSTLVTKIDAHNLKNQIKKEFLHSRVTSIAAFNDQYLYGIFSDDKTKQAIISRVTDPEEDKDVSLVKSKNTMVKTHNTPIENLYFDDTFIVSHSQAGTIKIRHLQKKEFMITPLQALVFDPDTVLPFIEYSAERLVAYRTKCMIVEESSLLPGSDAAIYIKYLNDNGEIIADKKIRSYRKPIVGKNQKVHTYSPFCGAINEGGATIIYDQSNRSLIHSFKVADGGIHSIEYSSYKYTKKESSESGGLPEELNRHVAQAVHYVGNNVLFIYPDRIYKVSLPENEKAKETLKTELIFAVGQPKITPDTQPKELKTIVATALQNNHTLWVIMKKRTRYTIQSLSIVENQ